MRIINIGIFERVKGIYVWKKEFTFVRAAICMMLQYSIT